jgi:hypothetical protein
MWSPPLLTLDKHGNLQRHLPGPHLPLSQPPSLCPSKLPCCLLRTLASPVYGWCGPPSILGMIPPSPLDVRWGKVLDTAFLFLTKLTTTVILHSSVTTGFMTSSHQSEDPWGRWPCLCAQNTVKNTLPVYTGGWLTICGWLNKRNA